MARNGAEAHYAGRAEDAAEDAADALSTVVGGAACVFQAAAGSLGPNGAIQGQYGLPGAGSLPLVVGLGSPGSGDWDQCLSDTE